MTSLIVWLLLTVIPSVWGDASYNWRNCYDIDLNTGIPGVPRVPVLQPCLSVDLDTCGDMSLHASISISSTTVRFNISSANNLRACVPLPSPYNTICTNMCLMVDPTTFRLTHSYARFQPYVQFQDGPICPGIRFPNPPSPPYEIGVDCDSQANTTCDTCTTTSDQGICAWCSTTRACVATSSVSTTLCNGVAMCPIDVQHRGMCSSQGTGTVPPTTPTQAPTVVPPSPTPTPTCANPMFAGRLQVTGSRLNLLSTPAVVANASCPNLAGQPQCCAKGTFDQWKQMMKQFDQGAIIASKDKGNISIDDLIRILSTDGLLPNFTQPTQDQRDQLNLLLNIFKQLDQPLQTCSKAVVAYWNGLMCFSCHSDWNTYYNPDTKELRLSIDTCDAADAGCSPVLRIINSKKMDIMKIMIKLYDSSGDHTYDNINNAMKAAVAAFSAAPWLEPDICAVGWKGAKNCREVVCNKFLHGLDYNFSLPDLNTRSTRMMHTSSVSSASSFSSSPIDWLLPSLTPTSASKIRSIFRYVVSVTQHINTNNHDITLNTMPVGQQPTPTGGHAINTYVDGGYLVNTIGCTAQMSTQACPVPSPSPSSNGDSSSKSNMGLIIGILVAVGIGITAIFVLFYYIRKRRTTNRVPPHRRLQDEDFGIGGVTTPDGSAYSRFDPRL